MLGDRLRELRIKNHWTQNKVAELLGVSRPAYTHYETGERSLDPTTLAKLCNLFGVSSDYLLGLSDDPRSAMKTTLSAGSDQGLLGISLSEEELETLLTILQDPDAMVMFRDFSSMGESDRRKLLKIWKAMVDDDKE